MNRETGMKAMRAIMFIAFVAALLSLLNVRVRAHGDEDHGEKKAPAITTSANMMVRVARAGDYEVTLKHPPIAPDQETAARVFVTRFESNEFVGGAKLFFTLAGGGKSFEAAAAPGNAPGLYDLKLPPAPEGEYKLAARLEVGRTTQTIDYGAVRVIVPPPAASSESSRTLPLLITLGIIFGFGLIGALIYRSARQSRRDRVKGEAATA